MAILIDVEDLDMMNLRMLHELKATQENPIRFLQHLKLARTILNDKDSSSNKCND